VDPLEVTRPMADVSWTSQSPQATSPSILIRQPTRTSPGPWPPVASHVFGPLTTQVDPDPPDRPETGISPWFPPDSRSLPRSDPGSLPWQDPGSLQIYAKLMFYGIMVLGMFSTVVGRKVLSHFCFIVTACHYLINYMKDSCCFIDDYCSVIILFCAL